MPAELVFLGTVLTVDEARPTAEALAVADGRIVAVGNRADVDVWIGPDTEIVELGDACVMPGLIEAHGHPLMEAVVLSDRMVDIRPVTMRDPDAVVAAIRAEVAKRGAEGAYLNGWDPLLQTGGQERSDPGRLTGGQERSDPGRLTRLPEPTLAWLNDIAPDSPLVIVHNSGHKVFFNSAAAARTGVTRDTPDPKGSRFGHDANGELDGTGEETGAVFALMSGAITPGDYPAMLHAELGRLNRAGLTTCSEMAFDPVFRPMVEQMRGDLTVRLRAYEISNAQLATDMVPVNGDDVFRQVGIKIWVDGSPWIGNIDLSFPYLDTDATRTIGVTPGSCGHANYTPEQLTEIVHAYFPKGWPMACHVQGDAGVDTILDIYEEALRRWPRDDHRLRLEHVGAIRDEQLQRAHDLGVTCSLFVDQIHYWGDIIVDGLFGPEHGTRWMPCGSAVKTGMRISLHNDPPVTPEEPLRNIGVAVTRTAPSGRVMGPEERLTVEQAIRAQTIDAAYQLFCDDVTGSLEVGKYADLVVLAADPRAVPPEDIADLEVRATYLAGRRVYVKGG
jgi:predicted amidohydrolase YtcJ